MSMHHALLAQQMANPAPGGGEWGDWVHYWGMTDIAGNVAPDRIGGVDITFTNPTLTVGAADSGIVADIGDSDIPSILNLAPGAGNEMSLVIAHECLAVSGTPFHGRNSPLSTYRPIGCYRDTSRYQMRSTLSGNGVRALLISYVASRKSVLAWVRTDSTAYAMVTDGVVTDSTSDTPDPEMSTMIDTAIGCMWGVGGNGSYGSRLINLYWAGVLNRAITVEELEDFQSGGRPFA